MSVLYFLAQRFVAGETLDDAVAQVVRLNGKGMRATLDLLGENVTERSEAMKATANYLLLLDTIQRAGVESNISIKLTMLGLDIERDFCMANLRRLLDRAKAYGNFVRIDMEGSPYTQATLDIFHEVYAEYRETVGTVLQSYLYRTEADAALLASEGARIRLVKGAYKEPDSVAYPAKDDVNAAYVRTMEALLLGANYPAIASHDEAMIGHAKQFAALHNIPKEAFEFQLLYGIRPGLQEDLVAEGYNVRIYVPYGTFWLPYYSRRLRERKENILFVAKSLVKR